MLILDLRPFKLSSMMFALLPTSRFEKRRLILFSFMLSPVLVILVSSVNSSRLICFHFPLYTSIKIVNCLDDKIQARKHGKHCIFLITCPSRTYVKVGLHGFFFIIFKSSKGYRFYFWLFLNDFQFKTTFVLEWLTVVHFSTVVQFWAY